MAPSNTPFDWLVKQLSERCKEGTIVDDADLSLIMSVNIADYVSPGAHSDHGVSYGQAIQQLAKAVVAKAGDLVVPVLDDYSRTEVVRAPSDWLLLWSSEETVPSTHELWAQFDKFSARTPEGYPIVIDGPGGHSLENWQAYCNARDVILERRRLRRLADGRSART